MIVSRHKISRHRAFLVKFPPGTKREKEEEIEIFVVTFPSFETVFPTFSISLFWQRLKRDISFFLFFFSVSKDEFECDEKRETIHQRENARNERNPRFR